MVWKASDTSVIDIFSVAEFDRLISSGMTGPGRIRVALDGGIVPRQKYVLGDRQSDERISTYSSPQSIAKLTRQGATIILDNLHIFSGSVSSEVRRLEFETGQKIYATAFMTPAGKSGLQYHHDVQSAMLIQISGSKTWRCKSPVVTDPLLDEEFQPDRNRDESSKVILEATLHPGDVLWIPRGFLHSGVSTDESSLHVSFAFEVFTKYWLVEQIIKHLDRTAEHFTPLRQDLPWGTRMKEEGIKSVITDVIRDLSALLPEADAGGLLEKISQSMAGRPSEPFLATSSFAFPATITANTPVVMVTEAVSQVERVSGGKVVLTIGSFKMGIIGPAGKLIEEIWREDSTDPWCAKDLVPAVDEAFAVELVSRMFQEGVVRRHTAGPELEHLDPTDHGASPRSGQPAVPPGPEFP
ncbi:JmjC domain-containing protein [Streptomyces chartreusis]|uniref:JmjC domain-containing protein n=1 Tax=Streptomyces chartreusis TaxID=1969 RepID=UPI0036B62084